MKYQAAKKVPGGKLVRIKIDADSNINKVQISGDFFLHPEESLPFIEEQISGLSVSTTEDLFASIIQKAITERRANFIGVSATDIAELVVEALHTK